MKTFGKRCDYDREIISLKLTRRIQPRFQPLSARRIYIPKANGKQRPLDMPIIRDRIVQRAMLMAMEPIWENDFHSLSYCFRPERRVHHAIRTVKLLGLRDYFYNQERFHQSLGYATPNQVYASASGGGARIVDKFGGEKKHALSRQKNWGSAIPLQ